MVKFPISPSLLLSRRSYAVAAENVRVVQPANKVVRKAAATTTEQGSFEAAVEKKEAFWMRDPNTGNWIPEDRFGEIDAAELREKFLPKKQ